MACHEGQRQGHGRVHANHAATILQDTLNNIYTDTEIWIVTEEPDAKHIPVPQATSSSILLVLYENPKVCITNFNPLKTNTDRFI